MNNINIWITKEINEFVATSSDNSLKNAANDKAWDAPLTGFSNGADQLFHTIKNHIGSRLYTPQEIFKAAFPDISIIPEDLSIICWILPKTEIIKNDNRKQTKEPSERWVRARNHGETFNNLLRQHVVNLLEKKGYKAIAPVCSPFFEWGPDTQHQYASSWSERHVAYISGLGTFGICDGFITPLGKAVRIGSVVTNAPLTSSERPYTHYNEYCRRFNNGSCDACIKRCPAGAITKNGHDKEKCYKHISKIAEKNARKLKLTLTACGLCQTGVPCESGIPDIRA